jgi:hypothetical protein
MQDLQGMRELSDQDLEAVVGGAGHHHHHKHHRQFHGKPHHTSHPGSTSAGVGVGASGSPGSTSAGVGVTATASGGPLGIDEVLTDGQSFTIELSNGESISIALGFAVGVAL